MIKKFLRICEAYYVPFWMVVAVVVVALFYKGEPEIRTIRVLVGVFGAMMWQFGLLNAPDARNFAVVDEELTVGIKKTRRWYWIAGFGAGLLTTLILEGLLFDCLYFPFWGR